MKRKAARNTRGKAVPRPSELEWEVLKPFWRVGPMAARDVYEHVPRRYKWAYKTVKTMLSRMAKKGILDYDQIGNSYLYRAAFSREEMIDGAIQTFVERVFDGDSRAFASHVLQYLSPEDLDVFRKGNACANRQRSRKRTNDA